MVLDKCTLFCQFSHTEVISYGCTPLIQSPILYCVKAHMQKHYFFKNLKHPSALKSSIFWTIRTFSFPQAVFLERKCGSIFRKHAMKSRLNL